MATMTVKEFAELLNQEGWYHEAHWPIDPEVGPTSDNGLDVSFGDMYVESRLGEVVVRYSCRFEYEGLRADSLHYYATSDPWEILGVTVVDEGGDEIDPYYVFREIDPYCVFEEIEEEELAIPPGFTAVDWGHLELDAVVEVDEDDDAAIADISECEEFKIDVDDGPDLRFAGIRLAKRLSDDPQLCWSWVEIELYQTNGGRYVCGSAKKSFWAGATDIYMASVCESEQEVIEWFGGRSEVGEEMVEALLAEAGIDVPQED